jgi:Icc-related predicted phosphoesterase
MREAIISDIHGNLEALEAVLKDIETQKVDRIVCLGDIVGYGANPRECIRLVMENCKLVLFGNHEFYIIDIDNKRYEDKDIMKSILWTRKRLTRAEGGPITRLMLNKKLKDYYEFIISLIPSEKTEEVLYVHGSPRDPTFEYFSSGDVIEFLNKYDKGDILGVDSTKSQKAEKKLDDNFEKIPKICFNGHNHIPCIIVKLDDGRARKFQGVNGDIVIDKPYNYIFPKDLEEGRFPLGDYKITVNVGGTGQPRNCDPRASYFIADYEKGLIQCRRVDYDKKKAADKIKAAGLPDGFANRLLKGE